MISVIIPSYKNKEQIKNNLETNLPFLKNCEVIVVNDDPSESISRYTNRFNITLIENRENLGFGGAVNKGVKKAKYPYIMLLNSDVVLHDNSFTTVIRHFRKNPKLFAVSFAQKEKDGTIVGKNMYYWKKGFFFHKKAYDLDFGKTGWAEGGACLIDKEKFNLLGGFDETYKPFYWEDIDLSYRAWKSGYEVYFDPSVVVTHHHESTIGKYFNKNFVKNIAFRNQMFFIAKNITDKKLRTSFFLNIPRNLLYYVRIGEWSFIKTYLDSAFLDKSLHLKKEQDSMKELRSHLRFIKTDDEILRSFYE